MHVRFLGFSISTEGAALSLDDYIKYMMTKQDTAFKLGEHQRHLYFNDTHSENYYVGLLVTVKDQKRFCELKNNSGKLVIKVTDIDADSKIMDFNFFVINKTNGLGMFQYYHQSCSLNSFGYFNFCRYSDYRDGYIKEKIAALEDDSNAEFKKLKKKYQGRLTLETLIRKEKLTELMLELDRIKSFEYSFAYLTANEPEYEPLKRWVNKERTKLSFAKGSPKNNLADVIGSIVKGKGINKGKVTGIDVDGIERILRITDTPDSFGEYQYDDVADKINALDIENFQDSWVIKELLAKCSESKHIFEAKIK